MWSIAICDDNRWERYALEEALESYGKERRIAMETELFQDGLMLYKKMCLGKHYDLVFLDILMLGMDGIQVGRGIRKELEDEETQLVYMSHGTGNADLLVQNHPIEFLRKPFDKEHIFRVADEVRKLNIRYKRQFVYRKKKMIYQVCYKEIFYFQSRGKKIEIHKAHEVCEFYGKLSEILENGLPQQFVQIHQSCIINCDYIVKISKEHAYLKGKKEFLSISRPYRQAIISAMEGNQEDYEENFGK